MDRETQIKEVRTNFRVFQEKILPELLRQGHKGKQALLHNGELVEILEDTDSAILRGNELFPRQPFSVQDITDEPLYIGTPGVRVG